MWRKLRRQIAVERETLRQLLADHQPLLRKCSASAPDRIEVSALAAMLDAESDEQMKQLMDKLDDIAGYTYQFTLPVSLLKKRR